MLFADDLVDLGPVADLIDGVDELRDLVADWTPERVAATTGIPAERTRRLAHQLAEAERGVVYGRIGLCNQEFGTLASWLVDVVNILTGHFDVPGGLMFPRPSAWPLTAAPDARPRERRGRTSGGGRSRVRGAPEVLGHVPGVVPRRGDRHARARARSARCSPSPATRCSRTPGGDRLDDALDRPRLHDQRRQLDQRDHPPRRRDPARPVAARAGPPRRPDLAVRRGQRRQVLGADLPARRRPAPRVGDPHPARRPVPGAAGGRGRRGRDRRRVLRRARRGARPRRPDRCARATTTAAPSGCSTSRCAPARSATATARSPTASPSRR